MCALLRIGIFVKRQNCLTFKDFSSPHHHNHRYFLLKASATCFKVLRDRVFRLQAAGTPWGNTSWDRVVSPRAAGIPRLDATSSWKRPRCSLKSSWNPHLLSTCCWNTHPRFGVAGKPLAGHNLLKVANWWPNTSSRPSILLSSCFYVLTD